MEKEEFRSQLEQSAIPANERPSSGAEQAAADAVVAGTSQQVQPVLSMRPLMGGLTPTHGIAVLVDRRGNPYVRRGCRGPWWRLDSPRAKALVTASMYESNGTVPRAHDVDDAIDKLKTVALLAQETKEIWHRFAPHKDGGVEIFVCDAEDTRIIVDSGGVRLVRDGSTGTNFYATQTTLPFVLPAEQGDLKRLGRYLNLHPLERELLIAWLVYVLAFPKQQGTAIPILVLGGEYGVGKTFLCFVIQAMLDPNALGVQSFPRTERDFAVTTQASSVNFYDNMRAISPDASDWLCRAASGGMFSVRKLYSDGEIVALPVHSAIVVNSIHQLLHQPDLAQRCLVLNLLPLEEGQRRSESEMKADFERDLPVIVRGLLDLVAQVLLHLPTVEVTHPQRMIDFVRCLAAIEKARGIPPGPYQEAYARTLRRGMLGTLEEQPLAAAVLQLVDAVDGAEWSGTPADLLEALSWQAGRRAVNSRDWPLGPSALSKRLKTLVPALRQQGVEVRFGRGRERRITILRTEGPDYD